MHCGHKTGLTPPEYQGKHKPVLKPFWEWYIAKVKEIGPVDVHVHNGDAMDGDGKKETIGHLTTDVEEQAEMAVQCIREIGAKKTYLTYGTPFHTIGSMSYENLVASGLGCPIETTIMLDIMGHKFNFRHVSGRSDIPYGQGTPLFKEAIRDLIQAVENGYEDADYIVRGHVHYYFRIESFDRAAISLPALQLPESVYGRTMKAMYYHVGMVVFDIDKNDVLVRPIKMPLKITKSQEYICLK